jgi:hypothetical protein
MVNFIFDKYIPLNSVNEICTKIDANAINYYHIIGFHMLYLVPIDVEP